LDSETDIEHFRELIEAMALSFGVEFTKPRFLGYWVAMRDLSLFVCQQAVYRAMGESKRLPLPAELREFAGVPNPEQKAIAAWGDAERASRLGSYKHIDFEDKLINAVIRHLGGWPMFLSRWTGSEEKWLRMEFVKVYRNFQSTGVNGDACRALPGLSQAQSSGGIVAEPVAVLIPCDAERKDARIRVGVKPVVKTLERLEVVNG
jgi:hypothetical protein